MERERTLHQFIFIEHTKCRHFGFIVHGCRRIPDTSSVFITFFLHSSFCCCWCCCYSYFLWNSRCFIWNSLRFSFLSGFFLQLTSLAVQCVTQSNKGEKKKLSLPTRLSLIDIWNVSDDSPYINAFYTFYCCGRATILLSSLVVWLSHLNRAQLCYFNDDKLNYYHCCCCCYVIIIEGFFFSFLDNMKLKME